MAPISPAMPVAAAPGRTGMTVISQPVASNRSSDQLRLAPAVSILPATIAAKPSTAASRKRHPASYAPEAIPQLPQPRSPVSPVTCRAAMVDQPPTYPAGTIADTAEPMAPVAARTRELVDAPLTAVNRAAASSAWTGSQVCCTRDIARICNRGSSPVTRLGGRTSQALTGASNTARMISGMDPVAAAPARALRKRRCA
jgi:hypothetical protein